MLLSRLKKEALIVQSSSNCTTQQSSRTEAFGIWHRIRRPTLCSPTLWSSASGPSITLLKTLMSSMCKLIMKRIGSKAYQIMPLSRLYNSSSWSSPVEGGSHLCISLSKPSWPRSIPSPANAYWHRPSDEGKGCEACAINCCYRCLRRLEGVRGFVLNSHILKRPLWSSELTFFRKLGSFLVSLWRLRWIISFRASWVLRSNSWQGRRWVKGCFSVWIRR